MVQRRQIDVGEELTSQVPDGNTAIGSQCAQVFAGWNQPEHARRANPARAPGSIVQHNPPAKLPRPEPACRNLAVSSKTRFEPSYPRLEQVEQGRLVQAHEEVDHVHGQCPDADAAPT